MLDCYGPYMPLRVLEEVRGWKRLEKEHAAILRELVPTLEPALQRNLQEWEAVFEGTERCAELWLASRSRELDSSYPPLSDSQLDALLQAARAQSEGFIQHLQYMLERSTAVQVSAVAPVMLRYAQQSSRQQSAILNALNVHSTIDAMPSATDGEPQPHAADTRQPDAELRAQEPAIPIGGHTLPPLPYAYNALEPHLDEATMRIHHDKHHQSYVDGLNRAEKELQAARRTGNFDLVKHWERELAFNGAGHYLHTVFWPAMSPQGGGEPQGALADAIRRDFGSFAAFKQQFSQAAEKVEGGGWALLVWSPRSGRLEILQAEKHQNLSQWESIPLLLLDVWEHAYYLKHQNKRADYIRDWWNIVNWPYVAERYAAASQLRWQPY